MWAYIDPALGDLLVRDIRNGLLKQFAQVLAHKKLAPKTIAEILAAVKSIVASCEDSEGEKLFRGNGTPNLLPVGLRLSAIRKRRVRPPKRFNLRLADAMA